MRVLPARFHPARRGVRGDQAAQLLPDPDVVVVVVPIVAVHGAQVPWGKVVIGGVPVVPGRRLASMLRALPAVLGPERVADLADRPGSASTLPPSPQRIQGLLALPSRMLT
jgi:hypothetical protein